MRRVVVLALLTLVVALIPGRAVADTTVVLHGYPIEEAGVGLSYGGCGDFFTRTGSSIPPVIDLGPGTPPAGSHAWSFDLTGTGDATGVSHEVASMASTNVVGVSVHAATGTEMVRYAIYQAPADSGTAMAWFGRTTATLSADDDWVQVEHNMVNEIMTWTRWNIQTGVQQSDPPVVSNVPDFIDAQGGDGPGYWITMFGCDGHPFAIDAARIGSTADITTYDLEGYATTTTMDGSRGTVVAGKPVTLVGDLTDEEFSEYAGFDVVLEAKAFGEPGFTPVQTLATGPAGEPVEATVRPKVATTYRWRFEGAGCCDASTSPTFAVKVKSAVALSVADASLREGAKLVTTGRTTPAKPGFTVTLWRKTAGGKDKLGTAVVDLAGKFKISTTVRKAGTWQVFATVPAGSGNLAGTSATKKVVVRR